MNNKKTIILICAFALAAVALMCGVSLDEVIRILPVLIGLG